MTPLPLSAVTPARSHATGPRASCVHRMFEAQVDRTPHAAALVHGDRSLTYAELDLRAGRLARALRRRGAGPEVPVAVFLPRTPDLVVALLAVLKSGAAYVPLDPAYPAERVDAVLADVRIPLVVTDAALAGRFPRGVGVVLAAESEDGDASEAPAAARLEGPDLPRSAAWIIHTSGSTGRPKGVVIEHANGCERLRWLGREMDGGERARVLASTSVCFDVSVAEIFGTLCWGGTLVLVENALALASLAADDVATASMVPSAAAELLRLGGIPAGVRTLNLGGEPVPPALARALYATGTVRRIRNLYGPTEDTTYSTCEPIARDVGEVMAVGRPLTGTHAYVVDAAGRRAAGGAEGEIYLAGVGISRGYAGRPGATAERWVPDPFGEPGARMYRTGDLGRWLPDGRLECLGRVDRQLKVRGFRVEPGEVEAALLEIAGVSQAAVMARDDAPGGRALVAYVAAEPAATDAALRTALAAKLPEYMVPSLFVRLAELPRTPNGKLDRLALPAPHAGSAGTDASSGGGGEAGWTATERRVAAAWREVLGHGDAGLDDHLFALGGHSLVATQIVARLREAFAIDLPLPAIFRAPTVRGLAAEIDALLAASGPGGRGRAPGRTIPHAPRDRPLPLSSAQEAVRFFHELQHGIRSYDFQGVVRFRGRLDVDALERALGEIVRRHEIFRTTFPIRHGEPEQQIHAPWPVPLEVVDFPGSGDGSGSGDEGREAELVAAMRALAAEAFDIERLPLVRWTLFRAGPDDHRLLCVEHHFVHDGWSFGVFLQELTAIYSDFAAGRAPRLPEPEIQFADYAAWQRAWLRGAEAREHLEFWRAELRGVPPLLELPGDRPRPRAMSFRGGSLRLALDPAVARRAAAFGRERGTTLYTTLLAAFQVLMWRLSGQDDFCLGVGVAGRSLRETEGMIGMVVNTVPLRADVEGDPGFLALLERVERRAARAYAHQQVPFGDIVDAVRPLRSLGHLPLYQVAFNAHHAPYPDLHLPGLALEVTEALGIGYAKFDMQVIVIPRAQQVHGALEDDVTMIWEYASDLFDPATVRRTAERFEHLLSAAIGDPSTRISALPLGAQGDVDACWNDTARPYPREATLGQLFAEAAAAAPDAVAVELGGEVLTYGELDARSARLAAHLRARGAGPEVRVGVCLERSPALITAVLAIVRAGAAYVPLDPAYPAERLAWMAADAGLSLVVSDAASCGHLADAQVPLVMLDGDADAIAGESASIAEAPGLGAQSLAYVVYTSGSTGTPKAVGVAHRGVVRLALEVDYVQLACDDRVAQASTASFDAFTWEMWAPLLTGAAIVIVPRDVALAPLAMARFIRERRLTSLFLTTALFNQVAREVPDAYAPLRSVLFGGEAADADAVRRVLAAGAPGRLMNMYGPSEGTTYASWHLINGLDENAVSVPIGRPVANTTLHVLDAQMRPVPAGVSGELYVGGDGVARGYLDGRGLTADRFVPDPFAAEAGARLYRTGDRVRCNAAGALEFLGRVDRQVKIRGFRIEPGEVESALAGHPALRDAVVEVAGTGADRELVAYVVPAAWPAPEPAELRAFLAKHLPPYMVPAAFVAMEALPLTPNGKVDRRALPAPELDRADAGAVFAAPRTPVEERIAAMWGEVLGVERPGIDDDFFALGGHSLRATRVATRLRDAFGVELTVRDLFEAPTIRSLAMLVDERMAAAGGDLLDVLDMLEGLSDEEVQRLLGGE